MNVYHGQDGQTAVRSEINVTPLVDVCLVLLIIFMVIIPALNRETTVHLPQAKSPGKALDQHKRLAVAMEVDGLVRVDGNSVPQSELTDTLRRLYAADSERPVVVEGDRSLRYEQISQLLESIEDAGFQRVGLITERSGGSGAEPRQR